MPRRKKTDPVTREIQVYPADYEKAAQAEWVVDREGREVTAKLIAASIESVKRFGAMKTLTAIAVTIPRRKRRAWVLLEAAQLGMEA